MKRLLFVDHSYHEKTGATRFLQELLSEAFALETVWDSSWSGGPPITADDINARQADAVVFFQLLPPARVLRQVRCPNLTWACMRDGPNFRSSRLKRLRSGGIKFLSFSAETHRHFQACGQRALHVQYWPTPAHAQRPPAGTAPRLFFWPRHQDISWLTLKRLLGDYRPGAILLRYALDPGHTQPRPTPEDIQDYNITILEGWLEREVYRQHLSSCDIFMAPRPLEGIGMAMLEAMSLGLAVIAPNAATMNEYVRQGRSGWLYEPGDPQALDFSRWRELGEQAQRDLVQGQASWSQQKRPLLDFIEASNESGPHWHWKLRGLLRL